MLNLVSSHTQRRQHQRLRSNSNSIWQPEQQCDAARSLRSFNPLIPFDRTVKPNIYLKCIYLSFLPSCVRNPIVSIATVFFFFHFIPAHLSHPNSPLDPFACWLLLLLLLLLSAVALSVPYALCPVFTVIPRIFLRSQSEFISHKHSKYWLGILFKSAPVLYTLYCLYFVKSVIYLHMTHE